MRRLAILAFLPLALPRVVYAQDPPEEATSQEASADIDREVAEEAAAWKERDRGLFEQDALGGGSGLLHTQHAQSGAPGQIRVGFTTELFSAGFLCTESAPCPNPKGGAPITSDTLTHLGATLTLSATLTKWLEAYAATGAYGNTDNADVPPLLQVFGDSQLGLKAFFPVGRVLHLGGAAEIDLVNGSGAVGLVGAGTGAKFRAIGTVDLRGAEKPTPLRISLNTTYSVDDSAQVVAGYELQNGAPITRIERFGLEINRVDHIDIALGAEAFFVDERVRPFLEYTMLLPINRQGYACDPSNSNGDGCLATDTVVPSKLTLGSRFFPWKHGFSLTAGLDIGVTGVSNFIEELAPTPPWMLYLGAGWAIETKDHAPIERTKVAFKVLPPKFPGELHGKVHPKDKTEGIADAILVVGDHPDITSRVSRGDGTFSIPLDPGTYTLTVHAKGYRDGTCGGTMPSVQATVETDCPLEPALVAVTANEITISQQIQFQVDSAIILPESDGLMREIADTLIKNPRIKQVEVQGHTDSSGTEEYNQKLSEQRALSVRDWLTSHGVSSDRLVAHGYGATRPLIPNVTKGLKALNRRVQFIILQQDVAKP